MCEEEHGTAALVLRGPACGLSLPANCGLCTLGWEMHSRLPNQQSSSQRESSLPPHHCQQSGALQWPGDASRSPASQLWNSGSRPIVSATGSSHKALESAGLPRGEHLARGLSRSPLQWPGSLMSPMPELAHPLPGAGFLIGRASPNVPLSSHKQQTAAAPVANAGNLQLDTESGRDGACSSLDSTTKPRQTRPWGPCSHSLCLAGLLTTCTRSISLLNQLYSCAAAPGPWHRLAGNLASTCGAGGACKRKGSTLWFRESCLGTHGGGLRTKGPRTPLMPAPTPLSPPDPGESCGPRWTGTKQTGVFMLRGGRPTSPRAGAGRDGVPEARCAMVCHGVHGPRHLAGGTGQGSAG